MVTKEINAKAGTVSSFSKEIKQISSISREEFLKSTISFDEFKEIFAKKLDKRIGTNLCK